MTGTVEGESAAPAAEAETATRPADLRMARVHLRLGSLELARAELEAFAGAGALDPDALLDLAEVRWRTGDLAGAGVAAQAYIGEGGGGALPLVIAAEASASMGRPSEARRLAAQALERAEVPLERLFAGLPRSGVWPAEPADRPEPAGELFAIPPTGPASAPVSAGPYGADDPMGPDDADLAHPPAPAAFPAFASAAASPVASGLWDPPEPEPPLAPVLPPSPDPAAELAAARSDLAAGRTAEGAARLAIALRLAPSVAGDVLDLVAGLPAGGLADPTRAPLEVVRGDALRLLGREVEAQRSYSVAAAALGATATGQG